MPNGRVRDTAWIRTGGSIADVRRRHWDVEHQGARFLALRAGVERGIRPIRVPTDL